MSDYETRELQLIDHFLKGQLDEQGRDGWELVDVAEGGVATLRRPEGDDAPAWEYATVPLVPAARDVIVAQWTEMGYELVHQQGVTGYFKRPLEA